MAAAQVLDTSAAMTSSVEALSDFVVCLALAPSMFERLLLEVLVLVLGAGASPNPCPSSLDGASAERLVAAVVAGGLVALHLKTQTTHTTHKTQHTYTHGTDTDTAITQNATQNTRQKKAVKQTEFMFS